VARAPSTIGSSLDLDLFQAFELIRRKGLKRIGLQAPEGLKRALPEIAREISHQTGAEVIISGDPCFGACDIDLTTCQEVDLLFHLGHAGLGDASPKIVFLEGKMKEDLNEAVERAIPLLKLKRVGLATTVQHMHKLCQAVEALKEHGIEALIGPTCERLRYPGQVLGCCYYSVKAVETDEILFIGTGQFHAIGIALATGKRVVAADPVTGEANLIDPDPTLRRRFGAISGAGCAKRFAILVSKKAGQRRWEVAKYIKDLGEAYEKEMFVIYLDEIEPNRLLNLGIEAAVSTACPRVALDDSAKFKIPIITPPEFEILIGKRRWEDYSFDEII
jgi:2-(3-amino-3-carboxypropyl)histidine synthase